jgi:Zn-finger nucleic acid-binding protein
MKRILVALTVVAVLVFLRASNRRADAEGGGESTVLSSIRLTSTTILASGALGADETVTIRLDERGNLTYAKQNATEIRCPKCGVVMDEVDRQGVVLSICRDCRGTYFDDGSLEALVVRQMHPEYGNTPQVPSKPAQAGRLTRTLGDFRPCTTADKAALVEAIRAFLAKNPGASPLWKQLLAEVERR